MARSINKVIVLGNLGADPEVRTTPSGATVASFTVACSEQWKDKDGQKHEKTEWVKCIAWRGTADIAQRYLRKGSKVYVEGKLETRPRSSSPLLSRNRKSRSKRDRPMLMAARARHSGMRCTGWVNSNLG